MRSSCGCGHASEVKRRPTAKDPAAIDVAGPAPPEPRERTSSSGRMLRLLDLFTPEQPMVAAEQIASALDVSPATAYRYAADLCASGLLARFSNGFTLGPRIVELDYTIREHDPLLRVGLPIIRRLRDRTGCDVLLTEMFGERIIAVHHERGADPTTVSYSRGRPMPLFRGAGSKVILAHLPTARLQKLRTRHARDAVEFGSGKDWSAFRTELASIRRDGYAVSEGELDPQNIGIGVPVLHETVLLPGSVVAVMGRTRWEFADKALVARIVMQAGQEIGDALRAGRSANDPVILSDVFSQ